MLSWVLILLLAHLITDFVLQTNLLVKKKNSSIVKEKHMALFFHTVQFFMISLLLFFLVYGRESVRFLPGILVITTGHYLLDWIKCEVSERYPGFTLFLLDQLFHILLIILVVLYYHCAINHLTIITLQEHFLAGLKNEFGIMEIVIFLLCIFIMVTNFANIFIRTALLSIKKKFIQDEELIKIGRYIGIAERALTVVCVAAGAYEALAALYASKTAIRFGQAREDPQFGEYYIFGTSISALFGIIAGILVKWVMD